MKKNFFAPIQTIELGEYKVTYIPDGGAYIDSGVMYPASDPEGWKRHEELTDEEERVVVTLGGFLIEGNGHKVVMDLGFGPTIIKFPGFGPFIGGMLPANLAEVGVFAEDVTDVFYTHLHVDHVGWTTMPGEGGRELTFPNARYWCSEEEWNFWKDTDAPLGPDPETVVKPLTGVIRFARDGQEIAPGLTAWKAPGHTPGLTILRLQTGGQTIWFTADIFHCTVQFSERSWYAVFDIDKDAGEVTRKKFLPEFVKENTILADGHFSGSTFGILKEADGKYLWLPCKGEG